MNPNYVMYAAVAGGIVILVLGLLAMLARFYRLVDQGRALIVSGIGRTEPTVTFTGTTVLPILKIGRAHV